MGRTGPLTVLLNGKPLVTGRWWIEGDNLCTEKGGGSKCSQVVLNGNQLTFFDLDGYATMRAEYRAP